MMDLIKALEASEVMLKEKFKGGKTSDELEIIETLYDACNKYRSLYECAMKRIERYRDVASKPDICVNVYNKDRYTTLADLRNAWRQYKSDCMADCLTMLPFDEWLFMVATNNKTENKEGECQGTATN